VSSRSAESQRFASAAICIFLEASADDEDDLEAPGLDRSKLIEARGVLAAVLTQLELDWLEP
jgi:outer membrane scaffolding protein for murein synthesis (MipA/OmpV family)